MPLAKPLVSAARSGRILLQLLVHPRMYALLANRESTQVPRQRRCAQTARFTPTLRPPVLTRFLNAYVSLVTLVCLLGAVPRARRVL